MMFILELFMLFFMINFSKISCSFQPELFQLSKSHYLIVNEDGIFKFNSNNFNQYKKILSLNEDQNKSVYMKDIENIFQFKCFGEKFCIFINNYLYIISSDGKLIKKIIITEETNIENNVVIPFNKEIKDINTFNYILIFLDFKNNILVYFYSCKIYLDINFLLSKDKINLYEDKKNLANQIKNDFKCHLISNSLFCFISKGITDEIVLKKFSFSFEKGKIKLLDLINPVNYLNFKGKIIKSLINKAQSKILILYSVKDNQTNKIRDEFVIFNIFEDNWKLTSEINEALYNHNIYSKLELNSKTNMVYIKEIKKYIIYCLNERNELLIIELNENFKILDEKTFIFEKKLKNISINSITFSLINHNRKYQIIIFNQKNNNNANNNTLSNPIIIINLSKSSEKRIIRLLQGEGEGGDNPGSGSTPESGTGGGGQTGGEGDTGDKRGERSGETEGGYYIDFDNKNTTMPKEDIKDNRDSIMEYVEPGQTYELKGDDYSIKVSPMGQKQEGSTSIDFQECETKLRSYYNLSNTSVLSVFQTETTNSNNKSLTNKVQYVVYDENNTLLNLSVCEGQKISISYAIKSDSDFSLTNYAKFEKLGIDILNSSDPFFNDICYSYSDGSSDMILSDRINDIFQNYSLCDSGCKYEGLNSSSGTVTCSCDVDYSDSDSDDDDDESTNLQTIILSLFSDSTFGVIQCYKLVFSPQASNIGFWVFLLIILGHVPLYVWFFKKGDSQIKFYIKGEMEKYHYLTNHKKVKIILIKMIMIKMRK